MTEAGWSMVAFDYAQRNAIWYGFVMVYFCMQHIIITLMTATLFRSIIWETFFTVRAQLDEREGLGEE